MFKKQNAKPKEKTYEQVESYFLWLIGKYGDYTSKNLNAEGKHII
jgi:regulatory protein